MIKKLLHIILLFTLAISCTKTTLIDPSTSENSITLEWNKSYEGDIINNAELGLSWCYSILGAKIINSAVIKNENNKFNINISDLGFTKNAIEKIELLHREIKNTQEYQMNNSIDIGRYISLLIGSSEHYYSITNIPKKLEDVLSNYTLNPSRGYVNNSLISLKHRIIEYSEQKNKNQLFLSKEIDPQTNEIVEYETLEIMENGQLKFGIYDVDGNRINVANSQHTNAGKPAKCMWCHESNINQLFTPQDNFTGFLTSQQLNDTLINFNNQLKLQQNLLTEGVKFNNTQEHTNMELTYITFMEPSALRLSNEWNMSEIEVQNLLSSLATHEHEEFPFLGNLYHRNEVENFAPYSSLEVSSSVREKSIIEVNYID